MATELSGIRRSLRDPAVRGIDFVVCGVGASRARASILEIAESKPDAIVMAGFCGGADPNLEVGDPHVATRFRAIGLPDSIDADAELLSAWMSAAQKCSANAGSVLNVASAPSVTVDSIADVDAKSALYQSYQAATINMEDYWAAEAARAAGIPFLSVRAVLDPVGMELPKFVMDHPKPPWRVAAGFAIHPNRISGAMRLARLANRARDSLTRHVVALIEFLLTSNDRLPAVTR